MIFKNQIWYVLCCDILYILVFILTFPLKIIVSAYIVIAISTSFISFQYLNDGETFPTDFSKKTKGKIKTRKPEAVKQ